VIKKLKNPKTENYIKLKQFISSSNFPWFWNESSVYKTLYDKNKYENIGFYSHMFLSRPSDFGIYYPKANSEYAEIVNAVFLEIMEENEISPKVIYRMNANCVHPIKSNKLSVPHVDHEFPHKNFLIYLNNSDGETIVFDGDNQSSNKLIEDDVIIFEGLHCMKPPKNNRRIVLVITYL
jgi:hypothetical protein